MSIPADTEGQVYVSVKQIVAGSLFLPDKAVFQDALNQPSSEGHRIPVICSLISHPTMGDALFDLGMRKVVIIRNLNLLPNLLTDCAIEFGGLSSAPP